MCEAFPPPEAKRGGHPHNMVGRSISARLDGFESGLHTLFRRLRTPSSTAPADHLTIDESTNPAMSYEYKGNSKPNGRQTGDWERSRINPIQIPVGDAGITQSKGSKWKRLVQKLRGRVRNSGHGSRPSTRFQYLYSQSLYWNNFEVQRSVSSTPRDTVRTVKSPRPVSVPIWQRRNVSPIPPIQIPDVRASGTETVRWPVM